MTSNLIQLQPPKLSLTKVVYVFTGSVLSPAGCSMNRQTASPYSRPLIWLLAIVAVVEIVHALPDLLPLHRHHKPSPHTIVGNLHQIDAAIQTWALERGITNTQTAVTWDDILPYLPKPNSKQAPVRSVMGERYILNPFPQPPYAVVPKAFWNHPKGTVICFDTNGDAQFVNPK